MVRYFSSMFDFLQWRPQRTVVETRQFISFSRNSPDMTGLLSGTQTVSVPLLCPPLGVALISVVEDGSLLGLHSSLWEGQEGKDRIQPFPLGTQPGSCTRHFHVYLIGHNVVT